jgi:NAD(P)H-dependent flavin oxidoreductase YrpB (nitropropane dioxygenase family)
MPVAAPCCDQPGARFEDHAVFGAVVRGEHFSEALNGTVGLVHYLTNPLRAAARSAGDTESFHLWAGQTYGLAHQAPAAVIVQQLTTDAAKALQHAQERLKRLP